MHENEQYYANDDLLVDKRMTKCQLKQQLNGNDKIWQEEVLCGL